MTNSEQSLIDYAAFKTTLEWNKGQTYSDSNTAFEEFLRMYLNQAKKRTHIAAPDVSLIALLKKIAAPINCGCVPCRGQCSSKEALEIELEGRKYLALQAIEAMGIDGGLVATRDGNKIPSKYHQDHQSSTHFALQKAMGALQQMVDMEQNTREHIAAGIAQAVINDILSLGEATQDGVLSREEDTQKTCPSPATPTTQVQLGSKLNVSSEISGNNIEGMCATYEAEIAKYQGGITYRPNNATAQVEAMKAALAYGGYTRPVVSVDIASMDAAYALGKLEAESAQQPDDSSIKPEGHCVDCCCARAWKALGITQYTGKSVAEHITELRAKTEREVSNQSNDEQSK
jgi:hypothetical protein